MIALHLLRDTMIALPTPCGHRRSPTPPRRDDPDGACREYRHHYSEYDDRHQYLGPHLRLRAAARDLHDDRRGAPYRRSWHRLRSLESADGRGRCSMMHVVVDNIGGTAHRCANDPSTLNANNPDSACTSVHHCSTSSTIPRCW